MFKKFQDIYDKLPPCNYRLFQWPDLVHPMDFVTTCALESLEWGEAQLQNGTFSNQRDDYRELCELVVFYLGGVLRGRGKMVG